MFVVISIMFGGIAVGYLLRRVELLLLGITVGSNREIINNLSSLGGQALAISASATLGSLIAAWAVYHFFFKERRRS